MPASLKRTDKVFLNVPYGRDYEELLVALTAALLAIGQVPQLTFQIPDTGQGRLPRIFELLKSCHFSIHDLSAVETPVRFNMPFELGLAYAIFKLDKEKDHRFAVLDEKPYQLQEHLSDFNGIDPKIHNGTAEGAICAVLDLLERPRGNPSAEEVMILYNRLLGFVPAVKKKHRQNSLFKPRVYGELMFLGFEAAAELGL